MRTTHTPGPWTVDGNEIFGPPDEGNIDSGVVVARRVNPADAALIAAAPDLLEALRMIEEVASGRVPLVNNWVASVARAAIAKATGA